MAARVARVNIESMRILLNVLLTLCSCLSPVICRGAERPNILLIVSEDNGPELGCYGEPYVQTPVLDKLAAEGVRFENASVPQAGCSQSRAALLTGLYPHQNGQIGLATWKFRMYREDTPNLVRSLKNSGYRTGIIGKLHINPKAAFPFDMHEISTSNFSRRNLHEYAEHAAHFFSASEEPFFLSVNYPDAHRPFTAQVTVRSSPSGSRTSKEPDSKAQRTLPAEPLRGEDVKPLACFGIDTPDLREQTANYYNCLNRMDSMVGDLLDALQKSGKADNTLVVYLGDHGADLLRGKRTSYEGGVRIPLIVRWPGTATTNSVRDELVSTLDLMPTLLAAADADPVHGLPGRSLLPLLKNQRVKWREYLFTEFHLHSAHNFYPQRTVRNARFKLIRNLQPGQINPGYDFTLKRFFSELPKTIDAAPEPIRAAYDRMRTPPEFEFYDLQSDPFEFRNLAETEEYPEVFADLRSQLAEWRIQTRDPLLNSDNLRRLRDEVDACFEGDTPSKDRLKLSYPDYFFAERRRAQQRQRPNVLFIAIDDLRPTLGCFDDNVAVTPNIDRLAAQGTTFTHAYCQLAVCSPSRASVMTGRRPDTIRVWDLKTHFRKVTPNLVTLPQYFKNHGYRTQSIGKVYHGGGKPSKDPPSWSVPPQFDNIRDPAVRYALPVNLEGQGLKRSAAESADVDDNVYVDGMVCEAAETTMDTLAAGGMPFFLAVGFRKPHLPFCAPSKYWDLYERDQIPVPQDTQHPKDAPELAIRSWRELEGYTDISTDGMVPDDKMKELRHGYYACVSYVDALVGRLINKLTETGLAEKTIVVLWSDHGYHLGEQGLWTKANNFELATRVPLVITIPGQPNAGTRCDALVELVDLFPTLADVCSLPAPAGMEGTSLKPLLTSPNHPWKQAVFSQYPRDNNSHRHTGPGDIMGYAVRTRRYRYVEWRNWNTQRIVARELYDHRIDPNESTNVALRTPYTSTVQELAGILAGGWQQSLSPRPIEKSRAP